MNVVEESTAAPSSPPARRVAVEPWFRIASFPDRTAGNPHHEMFYGGLAAHGVRMVTRLVCTAGWIRRHASSLDAVHLHWPEKLWRGKTRGRLHGAIRTVTLARHRALFTFSRALRAAKRAGLLRVWTVHNMEPHEGATWLDRLGYRIAARNSDLIICYSQAAVEDVRARFQPPGEVVGIAHGNYCGIYPPPRDRATVMRELGLDPDIPLVCCIGIIRRYKGMDIACDAVRTLRGAVQLAICGSPYSKDDTAVVREQMRDIRGVLVPRALSDQEFADVIGASEAVLLPYRKITGSGSLLAAWTLGRGVIASDLPLFREMLATEPKAGQLFRADDAASLADAIGSYLAMPARTRNEAAVRAANFYSWDSTVEPVVKAFATWNNR